MEHSSPQKSGPVSRQKNAPNVSLAWTDLKLNHVKNLQEAENPKQTME
jgi:hypothetical protein